MVMHAAGGSRVMVMAPLVLVCVATVLGWGCAAGEQHASLGSPLEKESEEMSQSAEYHPDFWLFGSVAPESMELMRELGFMGVGYWGADREGEEIRYYFDSPTLEGVDWATEVTRGEGESQYSYAGRAVQGGSLGAYAARAHAAGLKVMVNMEGVNPYHWEAGREKWTPENISGVARDIQASGGDRWFTECVAGWPKLMGALAGTCREIGMEYQEGSDPTYLHGYDGEDAGSFPERYRQASTISMYHYHYRRDEVGKLASLAEEGSVGFGFARAWGLPCTVVYTVGHDWGELPENWEGILKATILIRALQFRAGDIMVIGADEEKARQLDVRGMTDWAKGLVAKNAAEKRPVLDVVVHLRKGRGSHWRDFATSGDAITSGAFHGGYDVVCSTEPVAGADAYYVYTMGTDDEGTLDLSDEIAALFGSGKPVFLQVGGTVPSGEAATAKWREVLSRCGVDAGVEMAAGEMPAVGEYDGVAFTYTGAYSAYELTPRRGGTRLPAEAIGGEVLAEGGGVPLIVGKGRHYLIPGNCLSWQAMYPISHLLSGHGVRGSSDVWGIVGAKVTALLATHDTELHLTIPGLAEGSRIRVTQWDRHHEKVHEEVVAYEGSYARSMGQFDLVVIEEVGG